MATTTVLAKVNSRMHAAGRTYDAAVVGLGPSGLATALALAHVGTEVAAAGALAEARASETRTAALLTSSVDLLKALGVWEALEPQAAPLKAIRIIDASASPIRAPEIEFSASELGLSAFGYNIANTLLTEALFARAQAVLPDVAVGNIDEVVFEHDKVLLKLSDGRQISARLVAGADGRNSLCRRAAGIGVRERRYDQAAIATSFSHSRPHENVSTELHREGGSVTTVPLPAPDSSALIWLEEPGEIARLMRLDADGFAEALARRLDGLLGSISNVGARAEFPVAGLTAESLAAKRVALVGEAAHILPPIGAQGLNLGLRDAASLADCVGAALRERRDSGGETVLEAYRESRRLDVMTRAYGVDLLSRSLLTSLAPLQAARGLVLHGLKALPPLRRAVMRVGLEPPTALPSLMRPLA